jgi:hypothetical protein
MRVSAVIRRPAAPQPRREQTLRVSRPGDRNEREAAHLAERVLQTESPLEGHALRQTPDWAVARTSSIVDDAIGGAAQPLDERTRSYFEPRFGYDFSRIRVHADERADAAARLLDARALAIGNHLLFRAGEFAPSTRQGQRILAHELAHTTQPATGVIHREAGVDARDSWDAVVRSVSFPREEDKRGRSEEAIRRFLASTEGTSLINNLWRIFCGRRRGCRSHVTVAFRDDLSAVASHAEGFFSPETPDEPLYEVLVKNQTPRAEETRSVRLPTAWPSQRHVRFTYEYEQPESQMAAALHHELTHVWFIHANRGARYPTGHGQDVEAGQVEEAFGARLQAFATDMDALEARMRREAEQQQRERAAAAPEPRQQPAPEPPRTPQRPPFFGVQGTAQGGVASLGGVRGTAILGADLILERIASLRVGARGVYLSPDHLFAGGAIGFRFLQGTDEVRGRVENPLFFDIEAGVLAEITPSDATRVTNHVAAFGSAGIGQEYGRSGTRFFWNVGGFVIVTDRGEAGGGAAAGVGFRR